MSVFVDTSAFMAMLNSEDPEHITSLRIWNNLMDEEQVVVTTNYVVVETSALLQRRFGFSPARRFFETIMPVLQVEWINPELHADSVVSILVANRRALSLADWASFVVMRRLSISLAFAFDKHFIEQGFVCLT